MLEAPANPSNNQFKIQNNKMQHNITGNVVLFKTLLVSKWWVINITNIYIFLQKYFGSANTILGFFKQTKPFRHLELSKNI